MSAHPNILVLVSDQHSPTVMGCAGDPHVRTPHLDELAAAGTRMDSAYCPSPLCGPSRASFMTGLLPVRTGVFMNWDSLPSHLPTFAHALTVAGYDSVLCGRMHFVGPDQRHGFAERLVGDFGPTDVAATMHDSGIFRNTTGQDARRLADSSGPGLSDLMQYDDEVTEAACRRIEEQADGSPLLLTVGLYGPHNPYACEKELFEHYHRVLPRIGEEDVQAFAADSHPALQKWLESRHLPGLDPDIRHAARAGYYGLVERLDGLVGKMVEAARRKFGEDLVILYISDHGDMAGEKGLFWKSTFYEGSVGVPWIAQGAGIVRGVVHSGPVSLLDLAPTLCELAGAPALPDTDGLSLATTFAGGSRPDPQRPIPATLTDRTRGWSAMIRKNHYKLVEHHGYPTTQLFDLADDPGEQHDLGAEPAHAETVRELRRHLDGNWDPAREKRHAEGSAARRDLFRAWSERTGAAPVEHWQGELDRLWYERPVKGCPESAGNGGPC
jgi:choline-sulfatase